MDTLALFVSAIALGLLQVGGKLLDKGVIEPALEPATERLKKWLQRDYRRAAEDKSLLDAVRAALEEAGAPAQDADALLGWFKQVGLDRLTAKNNDALRRQVARSVLAFTDPAADPPDDLVVALGWPRSRQRELATLLAALRARLVNLADWQAPIRYADQAAQLQLLRAALDHLAGLDNLIVWTEAGAALRAAVVQPDLTGEQAAAIEARYRSDLVKDLEWHDWRGITQVKRDTRVRLADIYVELALLPLEDEEARRSAHERLLSLDEGERLAHEERRLQERVTDVLARSARLVVLGGPGAGKTISLRFIALMLACGYGAARLGLDAPYVPLMVRLADYARKLDQAPALSLCNYVLDAAVQAHESVPRLPEFLRLALEKGVCMLLLDGLDEVGGDPRRGLSLRTRVVEKVQQFADRWCGGGPGNRVIVTSRVEGYQDEPVRAFTHVELSPLRPPDEVEAFLLLWYAAHERAHGVDPVLAERRARQRVAEMLPQMMEWPSVKRLATNPLLLTILALIHENVGKLPNRRIKLYGICAQTLIESWRQAQTGVPSALLAEMEEETIIRVMAALACWLHESHPGGTASFQEWEGQLVQALCGENFAASQAREIAARFLHHARHEVGLLAERGLGRFGFFHLTFEEYLAARQIAWQRVEERQKMLRAHWEDPRWREVILLAAGQMGIADGRRDDVSDFIVEMLKMEPQDPADAGRQAVLAGRALADVGLRSVTDPTRRWVLRALQEVMQDLDPETGRPNNALRLPPRTRYDAGEALDELGWLPEDLDAWVYCPGCAEGGGDLLAAKYPVTNAQYECFIQVRGYEDPAWWSEEGWRWRVETHSSYRGAGPVVEPEYWRSPRMGRERRGYPVVGVSWYEAGAYCRWFSGQARVSGCGFQVWRGGALETCNLQPETFMARLPTTDEWAALAGGETGGRYPWDPPDGPATEDEGAILARANVREAGLGGVSPVGMYPLGASRPFGLADLAGNAWEWTASIWEAGSGRRVVRGGSWDNLREDARCAERNRSNPLNSLDLIGFRCVSPVSL